MPTKKEVGKELSDIINYCLLLAHELNINLDKAFLSKIWENEKKYPVRKSKGSAKKYTEI